MSEEKRLRDKLEKLAAAAEPGPRRLLAGPDGDLSRAVLAEIDETVLARRLDFRRPDGAVMSLDVSGRRLLAIAALPDARADILVPLGSEADAALAAAAEALRRFAAGAETLTVTSRPLDREMQPGALGRSAATLARALGFALYEDEPVPLPFAGIATAVLRIEAGRPGTADGPDPAAVARLSALGADAIAALLAQLGPEADRPGRFLLLRGAEEALFVGQEDPGHAIVVLLPAGAAEAVLAEWAG